MNQRVQAVQEGRALIRVRDAHTGELLTAGVCPGCWGSRIYRPVLLAELAEKGLAVVHGADGATGSYEGARAHVLRCPRSAAKG